MPRARVGDIDIHYETAGAGPAAVLIPGMALDGALWDAVVREIGGDLTTIALDPRGAGRSDAPRGPYCVEEMALDAAAVMEDARARSAVVVGHSLGGFAALSLALERPDAVAALVLVSTAPTGRPGLVGTAPEAERALELSWGPIEDIVRANLEVSVAPGFPGRGGEILERFAEQRIARPPRGRGVAGQRAAGRAFDARDRLGEIRCPCLVVHGDEDRIVPLGRAVDLVEGIRTARLRLLSGVGHLPPLEVPAAVAGAVLEAARTTG